MNSRHRLTYVDLHPEALGREKPPHPLAFVAGLILTALAFYLAAVFLFTL